MSNKFKLKKKLVSIALALALGVQPLASFPMNVFAGTGKNGVMTAPRIEKKTVSVPVPTTFTVPLNVTIIGTYDDSAKTFTITSIAVRSTLLPGTVKLGNTVISPGNVTIAFDTSTSSFSISELVTFTLPVTVTGNGITIASGTFTIADTDMNTSTCTHIFTGTFTQSSGNAVTFTLPDHVVGAFNNTSGIVITYAFAGYLSFPCDLMVPVNVTAKVTDDSIDIEATSPSTSSPQGGGVG